MQNRKLAGLFINCVEAKDSIFESGKMAFDCLVDSDAYSLDYTTLTPQNHALSTNYDFYLFNYHHITMSWLRTESIKKLLPGVKLTLVLEVSPNDPFAHCPPNDFDGYCVLDPTLKLHRQDVFAFPRPLEEFNGKIEYQEKEIPVIGSFGFATPGKGFENVVDAVNKEFEKAIVRINIPFAAYTDKGGKYAKELGNNCKKRAKKGVEVIVTHDFMDKEELIKWCGQNTLNCFLYDRNQPGLAATTDQAITSGRPLITSKNNTFRHIQAFIKPFPYQSLQEAIANTKSKVQEIQKAWSPQKFRERFEEILQNFEFAEDSPTDQSAKKVDLDVIPNPPSIEPTKWQKARDAIGLRTRLSNYKNHGVLSRRHIDTPKPVVFHSKFGEDKIIYDLFKDIPIKGISYLEIGANDPTNFSNGFLFYEQGFTGVLVEPNPYLIGKLRYLRPKDTTLNIGICTDEKVKEADFYMFGEEASRLSTFSEKEARHLEEVRLDGIKYQVERVWKIPLMSINQIIDEYFTECPDFISIGVRGWSLDILRTFDFERYSPAVFCAETLAYNTDGSTYRATEIKEFLETKSYFSLQQTETNDIFVNKKLYDFYLYQKKSRLTSL